MGGVVHLILILSFSSSLVGRHLAGVGCPQRCQTIVVHVWLQQAQLVAFDNAQVVDTVLRLKDRKERTKACGKKAREKK